MYISNYCYNDIDNDKKLILIYWKRQLINNNNYLKTNFG